MGRREEMETLILRTLRESGHPITDEFLARMKERHDKLYGRGGQAQTTSRETEPAVS